MKIEEQNHDNSNSEARAVTKRPSKIRDILTDRIVGIVGGACIPLVLLFIPIINKYLDNTKEIQTLQIQANKEEIEEAKHRASEENNETNAKLNALSNAFVSAQIDLAKRAEAIAKAAKELQAVTDNLAECQKGCEPFCASLIKNKGKK